MSSQRLSRLLLVAAVLAAPRLAAAQDAAAEAAVAASVEDVPAYQGQPGLLRVISAMPSHAGRVALAGRVGGFDTTQLLDTGAGGTHVATQLAFDYSILSWLDVGIGLHVSSTSSSTQDPPIQMFGTDAFPRVRLAYRLADFAVAGLVGARILGAIDRIAIDWGATGMDLRGMATYAPSWAGGHRPLRLHLNAGYTVDRSNVLPTGPRDDLYRFESSVAESNWTEYGAGLEFQTRYLTPFAEATAQQVAGSGAAPWDGAGRLDFGFRSSPLVGLILEASGELGRTTHGGEGLPMPAPWLVSIGAGYTFAPFTRVEVHKEVERLKALEGVVVDSTTGQPVPGAQVAFSGPGAPTVVTDQAGHFRALGIPQGETSVEVRHPDYHAASERMSWPRADSAGPLKLALAPLPRQGQLEGRVTDLDGKPVQATVALNGPGGAPQSLPLPQDGAFQTVLPEGDYQVTVQAPGFLASGLHLHLASRDRVVLQLVLRPVPAQAAATLEKDRITIHQRINFELNRADLVADARPILDEVVDILLAHPEVASLRIEGHTDDLGGDAFNQKLSEARAESVRRYLVEHGVATERLATAGYGNTRPLVQGTDNEARAANRRVEFVIMESEAPAVSEAH